MRLSDALTVHNARGDLVYKEDRTQPQQSHMHTLLTAMMDMDLVCDV